MCPFIASILTACYWCKREYKWMDTNVGLHSDVGPIGYTRLVNHVCSASHCSRRVLCRPNVCAYNDTDMTETVKPCQRLSTRLVRVRRQGCKSSPTHGCTQLQRRYLYT